MLYVAPPLYVEFLNVALISCPSLLMNRAQILLFWATCRGLVPGHKVIFSIALCDIPVSLHD